MTSPLEYSLSLVRQPKDTPLCFDVELQEKDVETLAEQYPEDQLILSRRALYTTKSWTPRTHLATTSTRFRRIGRSHFCATYSVVPARSCEFELSQFRMSKLGRMTRANSSVLSQPLV